VRACPGEPEERQVLVLGPDGLGVCTWQGGGVYESDVPNITISSREAAKAKAQPKKKPKVMKVKPVKKAKAKPVAKAADDSDDDDSDGEEAEEEGEDQDEKEKGGAVEAVAEGMAVEAEAPAVEPLGIGGPPAEGVPAAEKPKQA